MEAHHPNYGGVCQEYGARTEIASQITIRLPYGHEPA